MFSKVSVCGSDVSQIEQKSALGFGVLLFVDLSFRVKGESEIEKALKQFCYNLQCHIHLISTKMLLVQICDSPSQNWPACLLS